MGKPVDRDGDNREESRRPGDTRARHERAGAAGAARNAVGTFEPMRSARMLCTVIAQPGMNENADFIAKLQEIEELAHALSAELGASRASSRAQHIMLLARALRGRLEFGGLSVAKPPP